MAGKSKGKSESPERSTFKVRGSEVVIMRSADREILLIEGREEEFYKNEKGYRLKRDVYREPAKTLRAAAERYLREQTTNTTK